MVVYDVIFYLFKICSLRLSLKARRLLCTDQYGTHKTEINKKERGKIKKARKVEIGRKVTVYEVKMNTNFKLNSSLNKPGAFIPSKVSSGASRSSISLTMREKKYDFSNLKTPLIHCAAV